MDCQKQVRIICSFGKLLFYVFFCILEKFLNGVTEFHEWIYNPNTVPTKCFQVPDNLPLQMRWIFMSLKNGVLGEPKSSRGPENVF